MGAAQNIFGDLTRMQWASYLRGPAQYEDKLIEFATSPKVVTDAMQTASTDVNSAFDRQQTQTQSRLQGLGLSLNADEQHAADRSSSIARSLADVQAQNSARDQVTSLQNSLLGTPSPSIPGLNK